MVAIQENVDTIEQEVFHIRNEVRSDIEAKLIQIEQNWKSTLKRSMTNFRSIVGNISILGK